jgi:energy-coupling factor transport system ATP-binding protein
MNPAIEIRDAFCLYPASSGATVALQGLDLAIEPGEIVVALGPSGAGKSTLLRVLAGLERLSAGSARVFDTDLNQLGATTAAAYRSTRVGLLDQHYARSLSADLSCRHNVALQLDLLGAPPEKSRRRSEELLDRVGLLDRAESRPGTLSGGEQQRIAVCAAVAHQPQLLLADEPAGELDGKNAEVVYQLLGELVRDVQATALIVSHDSSAASIADRLVYIRDGRISEQARPGSPPTLVISRKGWARLPGEAGTPRYAHATVESDRIVLTTDPAEAHPLPPVPAAAGTHTDRGTQVELQGVEKRYRTATGDRLVLDAFTWKFKTGALTGLVGRSGSGKTTLLHLIAGLERPTGGTITIDGHDLANETRAELAGLRRRTIALVTQEPGLIPYLTALENVQLSTRLRTGSALSSASALEALVQVGLAERTGHRASDLSAGERERVAIARAIAANVPVLLIDEPTARLDEENAHAIGALLAAAAHDFGMTVICATHDPTLIELLDDTVRLD